MLGGRPQIVGVGCLLVWGAGCSAQVDAVHAQRAAREGDASARAEHTTTSAARPSGSRATGAAPARAGAWTGAAGRTLASAPLCSVAPDRLLGAAECIDCLCAVNPEATLACGGDCWRLLYCVGASGCESTDVDCIRQQCVPQLGGLGQYLEAAMQLARTPFVACSSECAADGDGEIVARATPPATAAE